MIRIERARARAHTRARTRPRTHTSPDARGARLRTPATSSATRPGVRAHANAKATRARLRTGALTPRARSTPHPQLAHTSKPPVNLFFFFPPSGSCARGSGAWPQIWPSASPLAGTLAHFRPSCFRRPRRHFLSQLGGNPQCLPAGKKKKERNLWAGELWVVKVGHVNTLPYRLMTQPLSRFWRAGWKPKRANVIGQSPH